MSRYFCNPGNVGTGLLMGDKGCKALLDKTRRAFDVNSPNPYARSLSAVSHLLRDLCRKRIRLA